MLVTRSSLSLCLYFSVATLPLRCLLTLQSVYMLIAAVLLGGSYNYLGGSDAGLKGVPLSNHHKTTGFGPFKLPAHSPLQKGQDQSPPKAFLEESSAWFDLEYLDILSYI